MLSNALKNWLVKNKGIAANADDATFQLTAEHALDDGSLSPTLASDLLAQADETTVKSTGPSARDVFSSIKVKAPSARYSTTKSAGRHARTGLPVNDGKGRPVELPSEMEFAKAGALFKHLASRAGLPIVLSEHEQQLLAETCEKDTWCGLVNGEQRDAFMMHKSLLDDATSGGLEAVPIWFDQNLITFPLLTGELFPYVELMDVGGRRIEGASVGNPQIVWGTGEGSAITPFDTTALIAALDTTVFPVNCGVEIGRDFLSDSPVDVGRIVLDNIGQRFAADLDRVIAVGDGAVEPLGITNASGMVDVGNPAGGNGAAWTVADVEELVFASPKQYRNNALRPAFIINDTTYSRLRGISVSASDQRRVFGMDHQSYMLLEYPCRINNSIANNEAAFGPLAKYRLYRRLGQSVQFEIGGKELTTKNLALLMVRGRFGGRAVDPGAFSWSDNFQA